MKSISRICSVAAAFVFFLAATIHADVWAHSINLHHVGKFMVGCGQGRKPYIGREVRDFHHLKKSGFGDIVMSPIGASSSGDPLAEAAIKLAPRSLNMSLEWSISSINVLKLVAQPHKRCRSNFLIAAADPLSLKRVSV